MVAILITVGSLAFIFRLKEDPQRRSNIFWRKNKRITDKLYNVFFKNIFNDIWQIKYLDANCWHIVQCTHAETILDTTSALAYIVPHNLHKVQIYCRVRNCKNYPSSLYRILKNKNISWDIHRYCFYNLTKFDQTC